MPTSLFLTTLLASTLLATSLHAETRHSEMVVGHGVSIETFVEGSGPAIVMLPSNGRDGAEDFDSVSHMLAGAGFKVLRPQPAGDDGIDGPRCRGSACTTWRATWSW